MKRAVLYARVSGDDRGKEGRNLNGQLEMCREYAQAHGYTVVAELAEDDRGASGYDLDLPELSKARDMAQVGDFDILVVREVDRLARNLAKCQIVEGELRRYDVRVEYALYDFPDTPEGRLNKNIYASFAEYEREKITQRSKRGRRRKAKEGKVVCCGFPPYGYKFNDAKDNFVIVEHEAAVVRDVFTWYNEGNGDGKPMAIAAITRKLSELRIPTPGESRGGTPRKRESGMWGNASVYRMLDREAYTGRWTYSGYVVEIDPIISVERWQATVERRAYNKKMSGRNTKRQYLLRGRIECKCTYMMCGSYSNTKGSGKRYYVCNMRCKRHKGLEELHPCTQKPVRADKVERFAWEYCVEQLTKDKAEFRRGLLEAQELERKAAQPKLDRIETTNNLIENLEKEAAKLAKSLTVGGVVGQAIQKEIERVNEQHTALTRERDKLVAEVEAKTLTDDQIETALEFQETVALGIENATYDDKLDMMEHLKVKVTVDGDNVTVECRMPTEPVTIALHSTSGMERNYITLSKTWTLPRYSTRYSPVRQMEVIAL